MNYWLITSTVLLFVIGEISLIVGTYFRNKLITIFGSLITIYFVIMALTYKQIPTAMDVYQGKTDIEGIYKDGKKVDSVVVFKNIVYCR